MYLSFFLVALFLLTDLASARRAGDAPYGIHARQPNPNLHARQANKLFARAPGGEVRLPAFGIFECRKRADRVSTNPKTGEKICVPSVSQIPWPSCLTSLCPAMFDGENRPSCFRFSSHCRIRCAANRVPLLERRSCL